MLKNQTTLKGVVAGDTFTRYQEHERAQLATGKSHGEVLDSVVTAGLDAAAGKAPAKKPAKKK